MTTSEFLDVINDATYMITDVLEKADFEIADNKNDCVQSVIGICRELIEKMEPECTNN
ncbi:hypothetical protein ABQ333_26720 [Serratia fonticola]|uniref:hypothetical protein n=1 Tax=Serratia fonticola TaxID=47917 RepID=UPI003AAEB2A1